MPDKLGFLFIGDIIGHPGRRALRKFLPRLRGKYSPDFIVANAENAAGGLGITEEVGTELLGLVDGLTSGNHVWDKKEAIPYLVREPRLLRPANYPPLNPGRGSYILESPKGWKAGVLNLQGRVFMEPLDCPFRVGAAAGYRLQHGRRHGGGLQLRHRHPAGAGGRPFSHGAAAAIRAGERGVPLLLRLCRGGPRDRPGPLGPAGTDAGG